MLELASIQYSNFAIYNSDDAKYLEAYEESKKAYYLSPSQRNQFFLLGVAAKLMTDDRYETMDGVKYLAMVYKLYEIDNSETVNVEIRAEFGKMVEKQLVENSNYDMLEKSYKYFISQVTDSTLLADIKFIYHAEMARVGITNSRSFDTNYEYLKEAYAVNAKDANLKDLILTAVVRELLSGGDSEEGLKKIDSYIGDFSFLDSNNYFLSIKANCLLDIAYQKFYLREFKVGENYLKRFEQIGDRMEKLIYSADFIEKAYSQAAAEYYKLGKMAATRAILKRGLKYAPDSFGLKQRLQQL